MVKAEAVSSDKMKCYNCGGLMKESTELIISKGRTIPQTIKKCKKCGEAVVSIAEYEKVRKELHPSIFDRIKKSFKFDAEFFDMTEGKVL